MHVLKIMLLCFIAVMPRYGVIDFVLLCSFFILVASYLKGNGLVINKEILCVSIAPLFILPITFIAYLYYTDTFGIVRLIKLLLLLLIVPNAMRLIDENVFFKWFPLLLMVTICILYVEYFNIFGLRFSIENLHNILFSGREVSFRAKGLFSGYSAAGVSCGFISLFSFYFTIKNKIKPILGWPLYILSFLATFFTGRTGIFISIIGVFIFVINNFSLIFNRKNITLLLGIVILLLSSLFIFKGDIDYSIVEITFIRTFELFLNYQNSGMASSESTTQLMKTISIPSEFFQIFFGNGLEPWSFHSINLGMHQSDSGLVQTLFLYGVFCFFLYYLPVIYFWFKSINKKCIGLGGDYLAVVIPLAFMSEIKGHYIYSNLIFVLILCPVFYEGFISNLKQSDNKN